MNNLNISSNYFSFFKCNHTEVAYKGAFMAPFILLQTKHAKMKRYPQG